MYRKVFHDTELIFSCDKQKSDPADRHSLTSHNHRNVQALHVKPFIQYNCNVSSCSCSHANIAAVKRDIDFGSSVQIFLSLEQGGSDSPSLVCISQTLPYCPARPQFAIPRIQSTKQLCRNRTADVLHCVTRGTHTGSNYSTYILSYTASRLRRKLPSQPPYILHFNEIQGSVKIWEAFDLLKGEQFSKKYSVAWISLLSFCLINYKKVKGKTRPRTSHEGPQGEQRCNSTLSLTSRLDVGG